MGSASQIFNMESATQSLSFFGVHEFTARFAKILIASLDFLLHILEGSHIDAQQKTLSSDFETERLVLQHLEFVKLPGQDLNLE